MGILSDATFRREMVRAMLNDMTPADRLAIAVELANRDPVTYNTLAFYLKRGQKARTPSESVQAVEP